MRNSAQSRKSSTKAKGGGSKAATPKRKPAKAKKTMARRHTTSASSRRAVPKPSYGLLWLPVFIFFLMLSGLTVFYVWERIKLREISREIIEMNKTKKLLVEENERLRAQAEELTSYRRIYNLAKRQFGFVELKPKIIYMPVSQKD